MTVAWNEHPEAREELLAAVDWYEDRGAGLGAELINAVERAIQQILAFPNAAPIFRARTRSSMIRSKAVPGSYPYRVIYLVDDGDVVALAYAHTRRRPGYWQARVVGSG